MKELERVFFRNEPSSKPEPTCFCADSEKNSLVMDKDNHKPKQENVSV